MKDEIFNMRAVIEPSIDIANSALTLAINRCDDLRITPVVCFLLMRELADKNARAYIEDREKVFRDAMERLPEDLRAQIPDEQLNLHVFATMEKFVQEIIKDMLRLKEVRT